MKKLTNTIVAVMVLCAGFAANVSASASPEISIRNALKNTFYATVSFAEKRDAKPTKPKKSTIRREKTVTFKQPVGKNFVIISIYKDSSYKTPLLQRSFDLNDNQAFGSARDMRIEGTSEMPTLWSGMQQL